MMVVMPVIMTMLMRMFMHVIRAHLAAVVRHHARHMFKLNGRVMNPERAADLRQPLQ